MAIALGAQNSATNASTTSHTITLTLTAGDLVVLCVSERNYSAVSSVTGTVNATYSTARTMNQDPDGGTGAGIYYFENSAGGSETITLTTAGSITTYMNVARFTGAKTSGALDQSNEADNVSATAHVHGSITTTGASVICTAMCFGGSATATPPGDFTQFTEANARSCNMYKISTGAETNNPSTSTVQTLSSGGAIANFLEASSSVPIPRFVRHYQSMVP